MSKLPPDRFHNITVKMSQDQTTYEVFLNHQVFKRELTVIAIAKRSLDSAFTNLKEVLLSRASTHTHKKSCSFAFKVTLEYYRDKIQYMHFGMSYFLTEFIRIMKILVKELEDLFSPIHEIYMQDGFTHFDHSVLLRPHKHNFLLYYEHHFARFDVGEEFARFTKLVLINCRYRYRNAHLKNYPPESEAKEPTQNIEGGNPDSIPAPTPGHPE